MLSNIFKNASNIIGRRNYFSSSRLSLHRMPPPPNKLKLDGIDRIIAVSSAKGGVGKSTSAVNIALGLSSEGKSVGILDADIFGPSIPLMMDLKGQRPYTNENNLMIPLINYGIKCMSMGFLVEDEDALVWRGPMVMGALEKLLKQVDWGHLDYLVIDLPPGTGDAILTICQRVPLSGAVIISTPQDVALLDAVRGVKMFGQVGVPIIGIVENMSHFDCPHCHEKSFIFGADGAKNTAKKMGINYLGDVPIQLEIRETSDSGKPITVTKPESSSSLIYKQISKQIIKELDQITEHNKPPSITVE
ncbi:Mrp/NBP35 family protein [Tieghemostelium lacteum]|uniref:Mrp/NBP35 family protein n=1 Tax=Tieghemostelium lacteum TaxID=361077 RepID=A0A151ZF51_TIELA|nr:Mrp/NBP35 family protein [Tieghemostelium lacteum]|eukprot:KYQ92602.1 Mrp/NBP35 family protein [Tieghemostelium lacteum]